MVRSAPRRTLRRVAVAAAAAVLGSCVPAALAQPAPSLDGESFFTVGPAPFGPTALVKARCNAQGQTRLAFFASGPAFGPYPGSFVEIGMVTIGPQTGGGDPASGAIISFQSSFVIHSGDTIIVGSKRLGPVRSSALGSCTDTFPDFDGDGHRESGLFVNVQVQQACYTATIFSPEGRSSEVGSTGLDVTQVFLDTTGQTFGGFSEVLRGPSPDCS
jgi:hypothetical protein